MFQKSAFVKILTGGLLAVGGSSAHAAIVLNDTFDIGAPATTGDEAVDPLDTTWVFDRGGISVVDDTAGLGTGNALQLTSSDQTFLGTSGGFTPTTLTQTGDSLTLSLDFRAIGGSLSNNASGLRFGLSDTVANLNTYAFVYGTGTSAGGNVLYYPNSIAGGSGSTGLSAVGTDSSINDNTAHNLVFTITRTDTGLDFSATIDGTNTFTASDTSSNVFYDFSRVVLNTGNTTTDLRYDNVQVEFTPVPEPSSLALIGLGGLCIFARRRLA